MKLKTLLSVYAATALVICLNFLVVPGFWITLYGATVDAQAMLLLRLIAALFGGLAVMAWAGRAAAPSPARDAMVQGLIVMNGLATVIAVFGAPSGVYNQFAWGPVGMFALFTLGFALVAPVRVSSIDPR